MTATIERMAPPSDEFDDRVEKILAGVRADSIDTAQAFARFNAIDESVVPGEDDDEIVLPDAHHSKKRRIFYRDLNEIVAPRTRAERRAAVLARISLRHH